MAKMTFEAFTANLEDLEGLKKELKRRTMIYQCENKENAAKDRGLPLDTYYDLSYVEWSVISQEIQADLNAQIKNTDNVCAWLELPSGTLDKVSFCDWADYWEAYKVYGDIGEMAQ